MNIPIFVPHEGCGHDCAFCNQRSITGASAAPTISEARYTIEKYISGGSGSGDTIAFFGGSFTGIDMDMQRAYLALAHEYLRRGAVGGIRLSTRPDYIDKERLELLKEYGVTNIELGAQSMDDGVLRAVNRGHSADDVRRASALILEYDFALGLQMMTGLPTDTPEKATATAMEFVRLGAAETRIYPTLVMEHTELARLWQSGAYMPQSVEEATELGARLYGIFRRAEVKVLRIGLSDSDGLKQGCLAGPYHPAMGELVRSRYIRNQLEPLAENGELKVQAPKRYISRIVGNKRCNIDYFGEKGIELAVLPGENVTVNGREGIDCD